MTHSASVGQVIVVKIRSVNDCLTEKGIEFEYYTEESGSVRFEDGLMKLDNARKMAAKYIRQGADEVEAGKHDIPFENWDPLSCTCMW